MRQILLTFALLLIALPAQARPVSYPGGWTVMLKNDKDSNSSHVHYTLDPKNSLGWRHEYLRDTSTHIDTLQHNILLKRWNAPKSQANLYLKSGAGIASEDGYGDTRPAAFTGLAADWEDRRYFVAYENRFLWTDGFNDYAKHKARIGIAPYIGDYGDLHTWLMLQADYDAGEADSFAVTPLVRFFKGATMLEAGYNLDDGLMFNFIQRF